MVKDIAPSSRQQTEDIKIIHCKVVGGGEADVYEIGQALKKFKADLPYRLEFIVSNERVELQDVDTLIKELYKLKKKIDGEKILG